MKQIIMMCTAENDRDLIELLNFAAAKFVYASELPKHIFYVTTKGHIILKLENEKENPNMKLLRLIEE